MWRTPSETFVCSRMRSPAIDLSSGCGPTESSCWLSCTSTSEPSCFDSDGASTISVSGVTLSRRDEDCGSDTARTKLGAQAVEVPVAGAGASASKSHSLVSGFCKHRRRNEKKQKEFAAPFLAKLGRDPPSLWDAEAIVSW
eukprot:scaffold1938_cov399-Prasinococcus_capsulatus_cf.AAC.3